VSRAELGAGDQTDTVDALLQNIKMIGQSLVDEKTGAVKPGQEDMEKAVLNLETEMRLRAGRMTSSKVAAGFVNEIMAVVTSYTERVRSKQISDEFLKGERSLKTVEKLLVDFTPKTETPSQFLLRMREQLMARGVPEADINKLLLAIESETKPAKPKKPRRAFSQAVFEGISKRLEGLNLDSDRFHEVVDSLSAFIEERVRERAAEFKVDVERLQGEVVRRNRALDALPLGVLLWDADGKLAYLNAAGRALPGLESGLDLTPALRVALNTISFPMRNPADVAKAPGLTGAEARLLVAVVKVMADPQGPIHGVILTSRSGSVPT
jgi:PAS domain-containing protein